MRADGELAVTAAETGKSLDDLLSKLSGLIEHFRFDRSGLLFERREEDEPARPLMLGRRRAV